MSGKANELISRQDAINALERDEEYNADIPNRADGVRDAIITISSLPSVQSDQLDETRLSQGIWTKVCKITDSEGLQHEVIHYGDLKAVIEEVTGWMI